MKVINYKETDIDKRLAYDAHRGTSFTPDKRAEQEIAYYMGHMAETEKRFSGYATDENRKALKADLERYRAGYVQRLTALLSAKSRVMSAGIVGPSNFPTARNQKRLTTEDKRLQELLDFSEKALSRLNRTYNPVAIAHAPIRADDCEALVKLQAKIDKAERDQAQMKAVNKIIRSKKLNDKEKSAEIHKLGLSQELLKYFGRAGAGKFPAYRLTNNNANIKRLKARLVELERELNRDEVEDYQITILGTKATVSENQDITRLQLFFNGKPPAEVRKLLKSRGFNWSVREGAWQRLLNDNAHRTLEEIKND